MDEPSRYLTAMMGSLDIRYDLGDGHPLLGRRMPDVDLVTSEGPVRAFNLLHGARPVLLNLGTPGRFEIGPRALGTNAVPWLDRVQLIDATQSGGWELPVIGAVAAPPALLIRPDGHVAWVEGASDVGLRDALTAWFGPPAA